MTTARWPGSSQEETKSISQLTVEEGSWVKLRAKIQAMPEDAKVLGLGKKAWTIIADAGVGADFVKTVAMHPSQAYGEIPRVPTEQQLALSALASVPQPGVALGAEALGLAIDVKEVQTDAGEVAENPSLRGAGLVGAGVVGVVADLLPTGAADAPAELLQGGLRVTRKEGLTLYKSIKDAPGLPAGFVTQLGDLRGVTKKYNISNQDLLVQLRQYESGAWKKVYKDGFDSTGKKVSVHYFESPSGQVFDVKARAEWSN